MIIKVSDLGSTTHDGHINAQNITNSSIFEGGVKLGSSWKNSWIGSFVDMERCVYSVNLGQDAATSSKKYQFVRSTINITYDR
jgi:hypothetical protein